MRGAGAERVRRARRHHRERQRRHRGGGLGLEHCAIANEGASCALEYVITSWGRSPLTHQAAAAVYERADTELLAGVRMYGDIEHPLQLN
jgi:hypothetical protein